VEDTLSTTHPISQFSGQSFCPSSLSNCLQSLETLLLVGSSPEGTGAWLSAGSITSPSDPHDTKARTTSSIVPFSSFSTTTPQFPQPTFHSNHTQTYVQLATTTTMSAEYQDQDPLALANQAERDLNSHAAKHGHGGSGSSLSSLPFFSPFPFPICPSSPPLPSSPLLSLSCPSPPPQTPPRTKKHPPSLATIHQYQSHQIKLTRN